jgi:hypothetical protein
VRSEHDSRNRKVPLAKTYSVYRFNSILDSRRHWVFSNEMALDELDFPSFQPLTVPPASVERNH